MTVLLFCIVVIVVVVVVVFRPSKTPAMMPTRIAVISRETRIDINTHFLVKMPRKRLKKSYERNRTVI